MGVHVCKNGLLTRKICANGLASISCIKQRRNLHHSFLPQGHGGRSSFSGLVSTVFGSTGFIGHSVVNHLGAVGSSLMLPYRGGFDRVQRLRLMGDLGQIHIREGFTFRISDEEIHELIEHSNCVINLIGTRYPVNFYTMEEVNVDWPKRLARIVAEKGDGTKLIHLTNINSAHEEGRQSSIILQQQHEAERLMREIYPSTTIVRSSNCYGYHDHYTNIFLNQKFSNSLLSGLGAVPLLYDGGESTIIQPIHMGDLSEGITRVARHPDSPGQTFEFVGANRYVLKDFVKSIYNMASTEMLLYNPIGPMDRSKATQFQKLCHLILDLYFWRQSKPTIFLPRIIDLLIRDGGKKSMWLTQDFYKMLHVTDRTVGLPGLADLGITPSDTEEKLFYFLGCNNDKDYKLRPTENMIPEAKEEPARPKIPIKHLLA